MTTCKEVKIKNLHIIINPASGKIEPILPLINLAMQDSGIKWEVSITKKSGDALSFARQAVRKNVDAIAVYGGDGSVMEVISGVIGSDVPVAILPGGTANVLATELNIPKDLSEACQLLAGGPLETRTIDVGKFDHHHFILRIGIGFEADMVNGADRTIKNKMGMLAYVLSAGKALRRLKEVSYTLHIDDKKYEARGLTCIIANSGNVGFMKLSLDKHINVSDGLLDVIVVRHANLSLLALIIATIFRRERPENVELVQHWQGRHIIVACRPKQKIQCDGEEVNTARVETKIIPCAVRILVPAQNTLSG
jgi:diacylglycerol kinase (ATP)